MRNRDGSPSKAIPLGYLGDETKTLATFPEIGGVRYSVPGDRARLRTDGSIELLGREAATISSGGEKIFGEEVEAAMLTHPSVVDAVVVGRESDRWGQEVVAVVSARLARCKGPKAIVRVDEVFRSPSGKADYRWARKVAAPQDVFSDPDLLTKLVTVAAAEPPAPKK